MSSDYRINRAADDAAGFAIPEKMRRQIRGLTQALDNTAENTTAAESRIRDTDMALKMMMFSQRNILSQAGESMLAQLKQSNQGVKNDS